MRSRIILVVLAAFLSIVATMALPISSFGSGVMITQPLHVAPALSREMTFSMPTRPQTAVRILLVRQNNPHYPCVRAHWQSRTADAFGYDCPITP